ncbi:MAG TPA: hypothetical protein VG298_16800 [Acidimicrobiales bacterium]|nr:hypothetical protein [Acidimicrobiales bacterium]
MIRLTWRQFRTQAAVALGGLVIVALVVVLTGPHLRDLYHSLVAPCHAHGDCSTAYGSFLGTDSTLRTWLGILTIVVPGLIGIFWGAPLVARELEAGTYRLAWTQSVTRRRWLAAKLGLIGLAAMVTAGLLSLLVTWWASPLDRAGMDVYSTFDQRDLVPLGYAALAFSLGVTAGVLIRRTLPAMAATLVAFVAGRLAFNQLVRPHLLAPTLQNLRLSDTTAGFGSQNGGPFTVLPNTPLLPNALTTSTQIVDRAGSALTPQYVAKVCPALVKGAGTSAPAPGSGHSFRVKAPPGVDQALQSCLSKLSGRYHEVVTYQPSSHYWMFQWYELGFYLVAALVLAGVSLWWLRRRRS